MEFQGNEQIIVVDASVIVKWFVLERDRDYALRLRDDFIDGAVKLVSPTIMPFEVLNAIRYSRKEIESGILSSIASSLHLYGVTLYGFEEEYTKILVEIAVDNDITIYDACYVALAKYLNLTLYTADRKLIGMLSEQCRKRVRDIASYKSRGTN